MFGQLFGNHLVKKGILTEEDYQVVIKKHLSTRAKIGTIAVADGLLSEEQVKEIHRLQKQFDKLFGDIAVEKGYLSKEQLEDLLKKQGNPYLQFLDALLELGKVTVSQIDNEFLEFQKAYGFTDEDMKALMQDDFEYMIPIFVFSSKPYVTEIVSLVLRNINRFVTRDFYIGKIYHTRDMDYKCLAGQESVGDHNIQIGLAGETDAQAFLKIASSVGEDTYAQVGEDALDAVCEFVNCISGLFAADLGEEGVDMDMEPVYAFENQEVFGDVYVVPIFIEGHEIKLIIDVDNEAELGQIPHHFLYEKVESSVAIGLAKGTVVIVDDSKLSRKILRNILEEEGYAVVAEATDGEEGIAAYLQFKPDVVTMDITMPNMNGIESLKEILAMDKKAQVMMISAAGQQKKIIQALKLGAKKFVTKPFEANEVISNIEGMMNQ